MESKMKRSHKRTIKTGTTIFTPHDVLKTPALVYSNTQNKISSTAMSSTLHTLISVCKGDTHAVNLHPSTAYRYHMETVNSVAESIKDNWSPPKIGLLHWDGKLMHTLDGSAKKNNCQHFYQTKPPLNSLVFQPYLTSPSISLGIS